MLFDELYTEISKIPVYDTHEHLCTQDEVLESSTDFFDLMWSYVCDDALSAGMSKSEWLYIRDKNNRFDDRWERFERVMPYICNCAYFGVVCRTLNALGIESDGYEGALRFSEIINARKNKNYFSDTFQDMGIVRVNNLSEDYRIPCGFDSNIFEIIPTVSEITNALVSDCHTLNDYCGVDIRTLNDVTDAIKALFSLYKSAGVRSIKIGSGYFRELNFDQPDIDGASKQFEATRITKALAEDDRKLYGARQWTTDLKLLDDYIIWHVLESALEHSMAVHIHTGMHAWNYNNPKRAHCGGLIKIINTFKDLKIVLLHCGFPHADDALLLAKYYPNTFLNFTWVNVLDRFESPRLLNRALEMVPVNKICAFGGDYMHIENIRGALDGVREMLAEVFALRIERGIIKESQALEISKNLLLDNAYY